MIRRLVRLLVDLARGGAPAVDAMGRIENWLRSKRR